MLIAGVNLKADVEIRQAKLANENLVGATDFLIWVNFTNDTLDDIPAINVNFDEWDYNDDGTPAMEDATKVDPNTGKEYIEKINKITTRNLADDASNVYYVMADGTGYQALLYSRRREPPDGSLICRSSSKAMSAVLFRLRMANR